MADTKISDFAAVSTVNAVDILPVVQSGLNKKVTVGQLKTFTLTPSITAVVNGAIPTTLTQVISVVGACTLPVGTNGVELKIISLGAGNILATGLLPSDGFSFASAGSTLHVIWLNNVWNVFSVNNMTPGI
jgi:hypothetical protein